MEITPHVQAIRSSLEAVAGDDDVSSAVAERISTALDSAIQLQFLDALSQVALELSEQLPHGRVELRLAGRDAHLVFVDSPLAERQPAADDDGATARLTLRMSDALKTSVEDAASASGVSTNAWLVSAVHRALDQRPSRRQKVGNHLSGYAQG